MFSYPQWTWYSNKKRGQCVFSIISKWCPCKEWDGCPHAGSVYSLQTGTVSTDVQLSAHHAVRVAEDRLDRFIALSALTFRRVRPPFLDLYTTKQQVQTEVHANSHLQKHLALHLLGRSFGISLGVCHSPNVLGLDFSNVEGDLETFVCYTCSLNTLIFTARTGCRVPATHRSN